RTENFVPSPQLAELKKPIVPFAVAVNCWVVTELFTIPSPANDSSAPAEAVMEKLSAPGLKTRLARKVTGKSVVSVTSVTAEVPKVATSVKELGTVLGVQFSAVFQSLLIGFMLQVALSA